MKDRDMIVGLGMAPLLSMTPRIALSSQDEEKQDEGNVNYPALVKIIAYYFSL